MSERREKKIEVKNKDYFFKKLFSKVSLNFLYITTNKYISPLHPSIDLNQLSHFNYVVSIDIIHVMLYIDYIARLLLMVTMKENVSLKSGDQVAVWSPNYY